MQLRPFWDDGFAGTGVRVGVFDTGIPTGHTHFKNVKLRTDWTHEGTLEDKLGHGSHVAGCIASAFEECPGVAPNAEIYTFKVFTNDQVSYTAWYLDAFNYAIAVGIHLLNLSIGGPDFDDYAFIDKVHEVVANGITMIAAIGNDGPRFGTLNNPGDELDVIGIGAMSYEKKVAHFSSRGTTSRDLRSGGGGRFKPDLVGYGVSVSSSRMDRGCRDLSGTSVASPVITGAAALLASMVPEDVRWQVLNPGSLKQILVEGADRDIEEHHHVRGVGLFDPAGSVQVLKAYRPRASLIPDALDFTLPAMWPHNFDKLYATRLPYIVNATIVNGMGVSGALENAPAFVPADEGGRLLELRFAYPEMLWPYSGYLGVHITVKDEGRAFEGAASGEIVFTVVSPPQGSETENRRSTVRVPLRVEIVPTPPKEKRILWDQFRNIQFPPGYIPRDYQGSDQLDWLGDHPHNNFQTVWRHLRSQGFYVEVSTNPATCFDGANYGHIWIVDPEEEFFSEELAKLRRDVEEHGARLTVFSEWFDKAHMEKVRFYDDNTRSFWTPATGGSNVPALNDLLRPWGAEISGKGQMTSDKFLSLEGRKHKLSFFSPLARWPEGAYLQKADDTNQAVLRVLKAGAGLVTVMADSSPLDDAYSGRTADGVGVLLDGLFRLQDQVAAGTVSEGGLLTANWTAPGTPALAVRPADIDFAFLSKVAGKLPTCGCGADPARRGPSAPLSGGCHEPARPEHHTDVGPSSFRRTLPLSKRGYKTDLVGAGLSMVGVKKKASPLLHRASKHSSKPKLVEGTPTYELEHKTALWQGVGLGLVVVLTVQFRRRRGRARGRTWRS